MNTNRDASLDIIKGLALIFMIIQHLSVWLWDASWSKSASLVAAHPVYFALTSLSAVSAPLFIFAAGIGAYLLSSKAGSNRASLYRGAVLLLIGYCMNLTITSWWGPGSWYVLHLIGFSLLTVPLLRRMSRTAHITLITAALVAAVALQSLLSTPLAYGNDRMADMSLTLAPLRFAFVEGHFPVFPWIAFYIAGYVCAEFITARRFRILLVSGFGLVITGGGIAAAGILVPSLRQGAWLEHLFSFRPGFYPLLPAVALMLLGGAMLITLLIRFISDAVRATACNPLAGIGRISLTVFISHAYIKQLVYATGHNQRYSETVTIALTSLLILLYILLERLWRSGGYRFGAEWLLRRVK
jgi:uncharacterized membrane protein